MFQKHICLTPCEITHYEFDNDVWPHILLDFLDTINIE